MNTIFGMEIWQWLLAALLICVVLAMLHTRLQEPVAPLSFWRRLLLIALLLVPPLLCAIPWLLNRAQS